ncbi:MAG: rod shape-determining protein MreD [Gammaproteobacteria bacterium]|nr:rod shape-determining protein MreD [Gammaproteobacteria bacterium]
MMHRKVAAWPVVLVTLLFAFVLTAVPLPEWGEPWRPAWVPMVLGYWCMAIPARIGIVTAWCSGILLDVLTGALFGQHALGLSLIAFVFVTYHKRLRVFSLVQQALVIGTLLVAYMLLMTAIDHVAGIPWNFPALLGVLTSMLLWPWVFVILRDIRRRWRIA